MVQIEDYREAMKNKTTQEDYREEMKNMTSQESVAQLKMSAGCLHCSGCSFMVDVEPVVL